MAGYVKGSKEWLNFIKDQLITSGDLLANQNKIKISEVGVKSINDKHDQLVHQLCDYIEHMRDKN